MAHSSCWPEGYILPWQIDSQKVSPTGVSNCCCSPLHETLVTEFCSAGFPFLEFPTPSTRRGVGESFVEVQGTLHGSNAHYVRLNSQVVIKVRVEGSLTVGS